MVWYQLTGLQGRVAKSQRLAHTHKRKETQQLQLLDSRGKKADLYNNIENWTATGRLNLSHMISLMT